MKSWTQKRTFILQRGLAIQLEVSKSHIEGFFDCYTLVSHPFLLQPKLTWTEWPQSKDWVGVAQVFQAPAWQLNAVDGNGFADSLSFRQTLCVAQGHNLAHSELAPLVTQCCSSYVCWSMPMCYCIHLLLYPFIQTSLARQMYAAPIHGQHQNVSIQLSSTI